MSNRRNIRILTCLALSAVMLAGCGGEQKEASSASSVKITTPTATATPTPTDTPTPTPTVEAIKAESVEPDSGNGLKDGEMYSYLTGEPIAVDKGKTRPFAIMIENSKAAIPQTGISGADVLYEAEAEGGITRMMGIFQDPTGFTRIGPIRSARPYYVYLSEDTDSIYTHYGWSPQAEELITSQGLEHLNGARIGGSTFVRDQTFHQVTEHTAYANGQELPQAAQKEGYSLSYPEDYQPNFTFNTEDKELSGGEDAQTVNIGFTDDKPYFTYDQDEKQYYRFEFGQAQTDTQTGEQLKFKNILVQQVSQYTMPDGKHQELTLFPVEGGTGYYATDGKIIPITWSKASQSDCTHYYDQNGNPISLNPGKTMVEVISESRDISWEGASAAQE